MTGWLDENCGADGWEMSPSGTPGVLDDAISLYVADVKLASAFVAQWCVESKVETARRRVPGPRARAGALVEAGSDRRKTPDDPSSAVRRSNLVVQTTRLMPTWRGVSRPKAVARSAP